MLHETQNVERVSNISNEEFLEKYGICGKPVVFLDLMDNWKAKTRWTLEFFKSKYGAIPVKLRRAKTQNEECTMRLGEYIDYMESTKEENPFYLRSWHFPDHCPELLEDYNIPEYFKSWHQQLPHKIRPELGEIYIGSVNTGTYLHIDAMMTSAWNAVISGRKRWFFYPPEDGRYLYYGKVDASNPDLTKYPLFAKARCLTCIQNPGEIIFIPSGWWHQVVNEQKGIAFSETFINKTNYKMVRSCLEISEIPEHYTMKEMLKQYIPEFYRNSQ